MFKCKRCDAAFQVAQFIIEPTLCQHSWIDPSFVKHIFEYFAICLDILLFGCLLFSMFCHQIWMDPSFVKHISDFFEYFALWLFVVFNILPTNLDRSKDAKSNLNSADIKLAPH